MPRRRAAGKAKKPANPHNAVYVHIMLGLVAAESNDNRARGLRKALRSVLVYPLPLAAPHEVIRLEGIGPYTRDAVVDAYNALLAAYGPEGLLAGAWDEAPPPPSTSATPAVARKRKRGPGAGPESAGPESAGGAPAKRSKRAYRPRKGSGAWALVTALHRWQVDQSPQPWRGPVTKEEVINVAQPLTTSQFAPPQGDDAKAGARRGASMGGPAYSFTAWSNMGKLVEKGLVTRAGRPARYSLTDAGIELGTLLASGQPAPRPSQPSRGKEEEVRKRVRAASAASTAQLLARPESVASSAPSSHAVLSPLTARARRASRARAPTTTRHMR
ncbi:crossover junction endonuclease MUS81 [Thecamonas trahens ATCC 50062]|uniref:Crossover junction endonuclease MUS81 n=1 Tax=Thecamonas trahens ATCC 50062 TaxID=461836 RepID=A0A0L0D209_THETB|nr:crossover junction endonuclease MUS81 [Thecamonas trahens ATCC 50062]KNC46312.1 crossover junction endonuclease MUS81 [Thecamonas trahens ATCC 50062]|eukprot:XP_013760605.1 crossover junction endonuclease MUS81 [Thecamonas trahens ATCC 50062]